MSSAKYTFYRNDKTASGISSPRQASTDAMSVISHWAGATAGRSCEVINEDDNSLTAVLMWTDEGAKARADLDDYCSKFGIERMPASE